VCTKLPFIPVTVKVKVPRAVFLVVVTFRVDVPWPITETGLSDAELWAGAPLTARPTTPLNPFTAVIVTVYVDVVPRRIIWLAGDTETVKSGGAATVTLAGAEGMPFAITNRSLAPVSIPIGTSKFVETGVLPVATPIVL